MKNDALKNIYLWIIKFGLIFVTFLPFYISGGMLFPFITGKNFWFRIITEVIFALWIGLIALQAEYRPRLTPLVKMVTVFIGVVFAADLLAPNVGRAFFSNYERMEGFMMLGHMYLYFLMLASVFRSRRDWLVFFNASLLASAAVSFIAFRQKLGYQISLQGGFRVDSTIGNPTYLAAYLMFHVWLLVLLIRQFWRKWWLVSIYAALLVGELSIIYFTATRGAAVALVINVGLFLVALVVFWNKFFPATPRALNKGNISPEVSAWSKGRAITAVVLITVVIALGVFWEARNSNFIQSSQVLSRLAKLSSQERTIQSRFLIWKMAWHGFLERPILGWGQENFYLVFQKYFDPALYSSEPWFDRSHDIIFDWLIHAGVLGLASYVSILGIAVWGIVTALKKNQLSFWEGTILLSVFLSYFIQNIFVFDNLNTYLLFFAFLAYTNRAVWAEKMEEKIVPGSSRGADAVAQSRALAITVAALVMMGVWLYYFNYKPMEESSLLINALESVQANRPADEILAAFQKAFDQHTFGDSEVAEQLSNTARGLAGSSSFSPDDKKKFVDAAAKALRKLTSGAAPDVKHELFLGSILSAGIGLNPAYAAEYGPEAEQVLKKAVELSPTKQIVYFELAQFYLTFGKANEAEDTLYKAWNLDRDFTEAGVNTWIVAILAHKDNVVKEVRQAIPLDSLNEDLLARLSRAYQQTGDYKGALELFDQLVKVNPNVAQYHAVRAALLANAGQTDAAMKEADESCRLDATNFCKEAEQFKASLKK